MFETRRILGIKDLRISVQCCRVPVAIGHYENVWVRFRDVTNVEQIERLLEAARSRWIDLLPGSEGSELTALATVHRRDRALVGRIRCDPRDGTKRSFCLTIAADNVRLGAATNAVRVAARWFNAVDSELNWTAAEAEAPI